MWLSAGRIRGASKMKLTLTFCTVILLFCPGLSFAGMQLCTQDDCGTVQFPVLTPPTNAEESRAIRDSFSWENTRPVSRVGSASSSSEAA
jgi:hypothetical protein